VGKWNDREECKIVIEFVNTLERLYPCKNPRRPDFLFSGEEVNLYIKLMPMYARWEKLYRVNPWMR